MIKYIFQNSRFLTVEWEIPIVKKVRENISNFYCDVIQHQNALSDVNKNKLMTKHLCGQSCIVKF